MTRTRTHLPGLPCAVAVAALVLALALPALADKTYTQNATANRLYKKGNYAQALKLYEDAALQAPEEKRLLVNRGSALYRLKRFGEADTSCTGAFDSKDKKALAAAHYNRGNALFREGDQLMAGGNGQATEKYQAALDEYTKTLGLQAADREAKWNLQLAYQRVQQAKQMQQQQQQNNKDQKNQDKQNQDKQNQQNQQDKNKQDKDKQKQDQQKQNDQQKQDQQKQDQQKQQDQQQKQDQKQQPQPQSAQEKEEQMKKDEAARLIRQFSDDAAELNKPRKMQAGQAGRLEKDW
jgi:flagellar biosynthesis GTPase FlhF